MDDIIPYNPYQYLFDIEPFPEDEHFLEEELSVDKEIEGMNRAISEIATDTIPFDKTDAKVIFACAIIEVAMDLFLADPTFDKSFASQCNDGKTAIGTWMNKIHEKIDHKNNPLDNQGAFDVAGNFYKHGEPKPGQKISFGGGDHRERTFGHDLLRFFSAIQQIHNGEFHDGGFVEGIYHEVKSNITQKGVEYAKMGWPKSTWEYVCHMFADFFSSKGLPCPGWSWLSHASDRDIRKTASKLYHNGMNARTGLLKSISILVPEMLLRLIQHLRYRQDNSYSKEAQAKKLNLMLLIMHGTATAVNIGKAVVAEDPTCLNLPMIVRTLSLVISTMKDQMDYNQRVLLKLDMTVFIEHLKLKKTVIITLKGVYYTARLHELNEKLVAKHHQMLQKRIDDAIVMAGMYEEYELTKQRKQLILQRGNTEILLLMEAIGSGCDNLLLGRELCEILALMPMNDNNEPLPYLTDRLPKYAE
ncbi:MAG: hypothetical protein LIP03_13380 [Bacteroidales bacterium]|nr:hypothetical protein [Bacteroidales bacterium]